MKTTTRLITTILALSILLSILAGVTVAALELNEDLIIDDSSSEEELMPMAARGCGDLSSWYNIDHNTKAAILSDASGNWKSVVGNNPNIYYNSNGYIVLCGVGAYSGKTYVTDLERSWYL